MPSRPRGTVRVRCFAYPARNDDGAPGWYAVCLDLDLTTWRPTFPQAKKTLNESVRGYFECIRSPEELRDLVPRPAPLWPYHFQYYGITALVALSRFVWKLRGFWASNEQVELPQLSAA